MQAVHPRRCLTRAFRSLKVRDVPVPNGLHKRRTEQLLAARGTNLSKLIASWRSEGLGWPAISDLLRDGYGIDVSRWTLARWFSESEAA
jgi:hypothetical protein